MFQVLTLNNISEKGLRRFDSEQFALSDSQNLPQAILLRSFKLTEAHATEGLLAVGRAGAGVNNIPVAEFTERGIVVFNTPGANANAVKELVVAGMLLSQRGVVQGIDFVSKLDGQSDKAALNSEVEAGKKAFKGSELKGQTLGVLGLGAIGSMVADVALALGMDVIGFDPALSVDAAWRLSSRVQRMSSIEALFAKADLVTLHVPALPSTQGLVNQALLSHTRPGTVLLNFARGEIVDTAAVKAALETGQLSHYISDFPDPELFDVPGVLATPHLGASTDEAEENCAVMAADQLIDFLINGNIKNSVNFPNLYLERSPVGSRIALSNRNVPRILGQVLSILADQNINVIDMINKSRDEIAYNLIDIEGEPSAEVLAELAAVSDVINVRLL
ncbi:MAG: phosphoglycerate dehydrogenase [Pseudomonadales bacterium]|jgi:D-3-phosphoglycerate dehydrogenase|nr:phosphoglycerate dehydrogenase [Pseudomonadales bacterium]MDA0762293.1 phosphoglycerate dehydrogenase [Pseudomonadota bacterium]MDA0958908.1 phosphoglycerate dehydrogenase [Pseudomonadota bacterium]MDA1207735.1 phosphoglycerate dehydrogenase [Pseudomonadota bacterium]